MARKPVYKTPLGRRLAKVRERFGKERHEFAALLGGISSSALSNYERGDNVPDASVLAAYNEKLGINIGWLVTEKGEMFDDPSKAPAPTAQIDPALMEKLYIAVESAYRDAGEKTPQHHVARTATELFNVLLSRVTDVRDTVIVDAVIPALVQELIEKTSKPGDYTPSQQKKL